MKCPLSTTSCTTSRPEVYVPDGDGLYPAEQVAQFRPHPVRILAPHPLGQALSTIAL